MRFLAPKRFIAEDYPSEFREIASRMFADLNQFLANVSTILSQGIVIADNMKSMQIPLNIQAGQTYPLKQNVSSLKDRPTSVLIGQIYPTDESTPSAAFCVHWTYKENEISYTLIGLDAAKAYKGNLVVLV